MSFTEEDVHVWALTVVLSAQRLGGSVPIAALRDSVVGHYGYDDGCMLLTAALVTLDRLKLIVSHRETIDNVCLTKKGAQVKLEE